MVKIEINDIATLTVTPVTNCFYIIETPFIGREYLSVRPADLFIVAVTKQGSLHCGYSGLAACQNNESPLIIHMGGRVLNEYHVAESIRSSIEINGLTEDEAKAQFEKCFEGHKVTMTEKARKYLIQNS